MIAFNQSNRAISRFVREREVLRATLSSLGNNNQFLGVIREILKWAQGQAGSTLPDEAWLGENFEHIVAGRNCYALRENAGDVNLWTIRSERPDADIPGRVWTTEAVVVDRNQEELIVSFRILVSSSEEVFPFIVPATPGFVYQLVSRFQFSHCGESERIEPWDIANADDAKQFIRFLINPARKQTIFAFTQNEFTGNFAGANYKSLQKNTIGVARVVKIYSDQTWMLTDLFGKKLSVFGGAARIYLPGFTENSDPYGGHDLIQSDELRAAPAIAQAMQRMRQIASRESLKRHVLGKDVIPFSYVKTALLERRQDSLQTANTTDAEALSLANERIADLQKRLVDAQSENQWLSDEHSAVEGREIALKSKLSAALERINQLENQIVASGSAPDERIELPSNWDVFSDWADQYLFGRITLTSRARREIKSAQFNSPSTAAKCLLWLANDYRKSRIGGGDGDLRISVMNGISNERCGSDSFEHHHSGRKIDIDWHIKNGGNTRAPERCLRIYYGWDGIGEQVIVVSMPGHLKTDAS